MLLTKPSGRINGSLLNRATHHMPGRTSFSNVLNLLLAQDMAEVHGTKRKIGAANIINVSVEDSEGVLHFNAQYHPRTPATPLTIQVQYTPPSSSGDSNTKAQVSPSLKVQDMGSWACHRNSCVLSRLSIN